MTKNETERFLASLVVILRFQATQQRELGSGEELSFLLEGQGSELLHEVLLGRVTMWDGVALLAGRRLSIIDEMKVRSSLVRPGLDGCQAYGDIAGRMADRAEELLAQSRR